MTMEYCPTCNEKIIEKKSEFILEYKGKTFRYPNYTSFHCEKCGEEFEQENPELDDAFTDFQRDVDGLMKPKDIKRIRTKFNFTQTKFAEILGVAEKSFAHYERGIVSQGRSMDNLLRILDQMPEALSVISDCQQPQTTSGTAINHLVSHVFPTKILALKEARNILVHFSYKAEEPLVEILKDSFIDKYRLNIEQNNSKKIYSTNSETKLKINIYKKDLSLNEAKDKLNEWTDFAYDLDCEKSCNHLH